MAVRIHVGNCLDVLKTLPDESVQTCVTSPPYYGLRDYGVDGQIGLEQTPDTYVAQLVAVFREVRRVLRDDGTLWLNLGDSYSRSPAKGGSGPNGKNEQRWAYGAAQSAKVGSSDGAVGRADRPGSRSGGLGEKQLLGIPWRVAFALQDDGWYLRSDIIWCLSGGAWVYARTQKGEMPVMIKDLVRLDARTVQLWNGRQWTQALGWGRSSEEGDRLEIVLRSGERIGCTASHVWPTARGNVPARELIVGDVIDTCRLPEPSAARRPPCLTDDALWLVGLYLAEGSRSGNAMQLSLCADEVRWLPRFEAVAAHYGGTCTHTLDGGSLHVRIYGAVVHAVVDAYVGGHVALDKHLKVAAWQLPDESLRVIVDGYLDGDGHYDATNDRWRLGFCRNYALERDLRILAARLGATITLKPSTASYQCGKRPSFRGEWRWSRSNHWNEKSRSEVVEVRASRARQFWDIAVEDEPHVFALASGVLTHNCKPNPMPESVTDRPTKAHEYVFLFAKSARYYYDADAVAEQAAPESAQRYEYAFGSGEKAQGSTIESENGISRRTLPVGDRHFTGKRNRRSVWSITTKPFRGAHFATMPPDLAEPCILAGSRRGDTVLDPFGGAGTTGLVADRLGRDAILIELNPTYAAMARDRIVDEQPMLADVEIVTPCDGGEPATVLTGET